MCRRGGRLCLHAAWCRRLSVGALCRVSLSPISLLLSRPWLFLVAAELYAKMCKPLLGKVERPLSVGFVHVAAETTIAAATATTASGTALPAIAVTLASAAAASTATASPPAVRAEHGPSAESAAPTTTKRDALQLCTASTGAAGSTQRPGGSPRPQKRPKKPQAARAPAAAAAARSVRAESTAADDPAPRAPPAASESENEPRRAARPPPPAVKLRDSTVAGRVFHASALTDAAAGTTSAYMCAPPHRPGLLLL